MSVPFTSKCLSQLLQVAASVVPSSTGEGARPEVAVSLAIAVLLGQAIFMLPPASKPPSQMPAAKMADTSGWRFGHHIFAVIVGSVTRGRAREQPCPHVVDVEVGLGLGRGAGRFEMAWLPDRFFWGGFAIISPLQSSETRNKKKYRYAMRQWFYGFGNIVKIGKTHWKSMD